MNPIPMRRAALRPPSKTHGGKAYLCVAHAEAILSAAPGFVPETVVDAFGGGGSFLLNADGAHHAVYNDLDPKKYNLFRVLRDRFEEFYESVCRVPYDLGVWRGAVAADTGWYPPPDRSPCVQGAVNFVVRSRMSRGGLGKAFGVSSRLRGGQNEYVNAWMTARAQLPRIAARVKDWGLYNRPAAELLRLFDEPDTLVYLDPPYLPATRTVPKAYEFEMTAAEHADLLDFVRGMQAVVAICGYRSPLYDDHLRAWRRFDWPVKNNAGQGRVKQDRVECLWVNR